MLIRLEPKPAKVLSKSAASEGLGWSHTGFNNSLTQAKKHLYINEAPFRMITFRFYTLFKRAALALDTQAKINVTLPDLSNASA